jgi:hypothetical protein
MKSQILAVMWTTLGTTTITVSLLAQPSYGREKTFYCDNKQTLWISPPHTGSIPLIKFKNTTFNNWQNQYNRNEKYKPNTRCKVVEQKLQLYFDCKISENALDSLKSEAFTRQEKRLKRYYPYIAITPDSPESRKCLATIVDPNPRIPGLLFMLPPVDNKEQAEANAQSTLEKIQDMRYYAVGDPIEN